MVSLGLGNGGFRGRFRVQGLGVLGFWGLGPRGLGLGFRV